MVHNTWLTPYAQGLRLVAKVHNTMNSLQRENNTMKKTLKNKKTPMKKKQNKVARSRVWSGA